MDNEPIPKVMHVAISNAQMVAASCAYATAELGPEYISRFLIASAFESVAMVRAETEAEHARIAAEEAATKYVIAKRDCNQALGAVQRYLIETVPQPAGVTQQ